jgi:hypothetical protein
MMVLSEKGRGRTFGFHEGREFLIDDELQSFKARMKAVI